MHGASNFAVCTLWCVSYLYLLDCFMVLDVFLGIIWLLSIVVDALPLLGFMLICVCCFGLCLYKVYGRCS